MSENAGLRATTCLAIHPILPQELVDWVIDHLHDDKKSLRVSSLVHRDWTRASSYHLFHRLRWPPCEVHWNDTSRTQLPSCKCHWLLDRTGTLDGLKTLLSRTPRIAHNVRELKIAMMWHPARYISNPLDLSPHQVVRRCTSPEELAGVMERLPRLAHLQIDHIALVLGLSAPHDRATKALQSLRLQSVPSTATPQHIVGLLALFHHIATLSIAGFPLAGHSGRVSPPARPIAIDSLELGPVGRPASFPGGTAETWLDAVCAHIAVARITQLAIEGPPRARPNNRRDSALSPALHCLLARCTGLRTLVCRQTVHDAVRTYPVPCAPLRELRLVGAALCGPRETDVAPWSAMVAHAMGGRLGTTVRDLVLDFTITKVAWAGQPRPDPASLERGFRQMLEVYDWGPLRAVFGRLHSLAMCLKLELQVMVEERQSHFTSTYNTPQTWIGDVDAYRRILLDVARSRLLPSADQKLDLHVSLLPASQ